MRDCNPIWVSGKDTAVFTIVVVNFLLEFLQHAENW